MKYLCQFASKRLAILDTKATPGEGDCVIIRQGSRLIVARWKPGLVHIGVLFVCSDFPPARLQPEIAPAFEFPSYLEV